MITAAFQNASNKVYFFGNGRDGGEYVRYDGPSHRADPDYPKWPLSSWWEGLTFDVVDAAFYEIKRRGRDPRIPDIFFFRGYEYIRWPIGRTFPDEDYPHLGTIPSLGAWGLDRLRVDAAFQNIGGTVYFFDGNEYVRCSQMEHELFPSEVDSGYPETISKGWGLDWPRVTAAFQNPVSGTIYLFNEHDYVRYSAGRQTHEGPDDGYPKTIEEGWGPVVALL